MVMVRLRMQDHGYDKLNIQFNLNRGWTAWLGPIEPDDSKYFETQDSALLAVLAGPERVPGVDD